MVFVIHIMRTATKANIVPVAVVMQDPVTDSAFTDFLGCCVKKGERNVLVFRKEDMERPFISYNENMWEFFEPELKKRLIALSRQPGAAASDQAHFQLPFSFGQVYRYF